MARTLTAKIKTIFEAVLRNGKASVRENKEVSHEFTSGTTEGKADRFWRSKGRSLAVGTEDIDLYDFAGEDIGGGDGNDELGQAMQLAEVTAIKVVNRSATGTLQVGGKGDATAFNSIFGADDDAFLTVPPLSEVVLVCRDDPAWVVTDTSNHVLQIEAVTATVEDWDLFIVGRSA